MRDTLDDLDDQFKRLIEMSVQRGLALDAGRVRKANRIFEDRANLSRELLAYGTPFRELVLKNMKHEDPHVRSWLAFLALEFAPDDAEAVLEQLSADFQHQGVRNPMALHIGFSSEMTLKLFRSGELSLFTSWRANR